MRPGKVYTCEHRIETLYHILGTRLRPHRAPGRRVRPHRQPPITSLSLSLAEEKREPSWSEKNGNNDLN